jgi:hypothetical protein
VIGRAPSSIGKPLTASKPHSAKSPGSTGKSPSPIPEVRSATTPSVAVKPPHSNGVSRFPAPNLTAVERRITRNSNLLRRELAAVNAAERWLVSEGIIRRGVELGRERALLRALRRSSPLVLLPPGGIFTRGYPVVVPMLVSDVETVPVVVTAPSPAPATAAAVREEPLDLLAKLAPALAPVAEPAGALAAAGQRQAAPVDLPFATRFVRISNDTGEPVKVFVQYRTLTEGGEWAWFPSAPAAAEPEVFTYELDAGMVADLTDNDWRVNASHLRVWAVSASGRKWLDFKNTDLELVTEKHADGRAQYLAPEMQTYLFSIAR